MSQANSSVEGRNALAALGFLVAGEVLERWDVVPLFTAVVLGITRIGHGLRRDHVAALGRRAGARARPDLGRNDRRRGTKYAPAVVRLPPT
jgi:hypothetical protein